jgi:putative tricarboxylic transport membrane protein
LPSFADLKYCFPAMMRGTGLGVFLGMLPGGGAAISSFAAYAMEKKVSKNPETFGTGELRGIASPEAANNSGAQASFIPMLTMGLPTSAIMALMIGAMMIHGIQPGPMVIQKQPDLYWGVVASMWIGNAMLLVINLPLIGMWVSLLRIPYRFLFPAIIMFCSIGAYASMNSVFSVWLMLGWGILGYFFKKIGVQATPLILGFVLGPQLEEYFRRAMAISDGNALVFVQRPISLVFLVISLLFVISMTIPGLRKKKDKIVEEE